MDYPAKNHGEKGLENALPWAEISQASYRRSNFDENVIRNLIKAHQSRITLDEKFQHLVKTEKILDAQEDYPHLVEATKPNIRKTKKINWPENEFRVLHGLEPLSQTGSDIEEDNEQLTDPYDEPKYDSLLMETGQIMIDFNKKLSQ